MRHPHKYAKGVKITFTFTYLLDAATAVAGILMFGDDVRDEITSNLIGTDGYPRFFSILMSVFIAIIPLTKLPLNARPIVSTIEVFAGLDSRSISDRSSLVGLTSWTRGLLKVTIRVVVIIIFVVVAILFPAFDSIMAFMGSALCFTICVILPLLFHMKLFGDRIERSERLFNYFLISVSSVLAVTGTVFAFLPKSMIGAE
jgi:vesicular inhibitory amino acid transporter